ncbi:MAG: hypothetical protein JO168_28260 [Solirubrobacterales bacterium]|nr:hypothetical protein [Solirubrobacterales bacterium]MBV9198042.1 hypothetical protein [Solirubrobacterales bacterium]
MTHPFHPWVGREFVFVVARQTWGEDRVFFLDGDGVQRSLPRVWTDAADVDPFVVLAAGRSPFRVEDLLEVVAVLAGLAVHDCHRL